MLQLTAEDDKMMHVKFCMVTRCSQLHRKKEYIFSLVNLIFFFFKDIYRAFRTIREIPFSYIILERRSTSLQTNSIKLQFTVN